MSTPETATGEPSSPELSSVPPLERALRYESVNDLWQKTKDLYYAHHTKENGWVADDEDLYNGEVAGAIRAYLSGHGLDEGSDDFARLGRRLHGLSFDTMFTRRWKYGDWVDKDDHTKGLKPGTSGESRVRKLQVAFTGRDLEEEAREAASAEPEPDAPRTPEADTGAERLGELRQAKYDAFVDRMKGSAFGRKRRENQEKYELAELAYMVALTVSNKQALGEKRDELVAAGKTDDEIAGELKIFAKREAEKINKEDQEAQHRLLVEKSGAMGRFLEWYGKRSTLGKVGLGLGLSAVAVASGVGIGFLAGAFGGLIGAGVATTAGFGLTRAWGATRTYQLRLAELYRYPTHTENFEVTDEDNADNLHLKQRSFLEKTSRDQLIHGEKVKRRAVYWALGTTAVGGALGVVSHVVADGWSPAHIPGGQAQHWWEQTHSQAAPNSSSGGGVGGGSGGAGAESGVDAHPNEGVSPSDELRYGPTEAPTNPGGKTEVIKEYLKEHGAANRIDKGEGWFQTSKELGIKREDWHDILQRVGPKLHDVQYSGVRAAYWDGDAHEWRINMTENHKMSPEALKIIVNDANNHDALKHALDFNNHPTGSGVETGINTQGVKLWEGAAPEQVLQKAYPGLTSRQAFLDINELYDKLGPKNVFEDVTLSEHTANNIWIDDTTGATQLTPDAQALWNQMHPEGKMLEQAIAEGRSANINIVTHGERWTNVIDKLKQIGITDVSKERYGSVLRQLWPQIKDLEYGDGTPVASLDRHGNMIMNESPTKVLDSEALRRLVRLLYKNNYNLAA